MSDVATSTSAAGTASTTLSHGDKQRLGKALRDGWKLTPATMAYKITQGRWIPAKHLMYISKIIAPAIARGGARIILTMPFRHGKSEFLSVHTPIWFLEKYPRKYVMTLTYGVELATDFSLRVRDTFRNEDYHHLLRTRINPRKMRSERFLTLAGGGLTAAGLNGPITGRGADLMLIDDYIKNYEEAMNVNHHKKTYEWFKSTAYTRLEPGASIVVLATRWAQMDLIGFLLTELAHENWTLINLPMFARANDPLGRAPGEVLWPERYPLEACERIRATLGHFWFETQCQQDPPASMSGADLGNFIRFVGEQDIPDDRDLQTFRCWDVAATEGAGDWTCGVKISRDKNSGRIFIRDMQRFQRSPGGVKVMVNTTAIVDGHGVKIWMEQEPGSSGLTVIKDFTELLKGFSFVGERATGPIEVRASPFLAAVEQRNIFGLRAPWNQALVTEINAFPDGEHDDQITACSLGYNKLVLGIGGAVTWGRDAVKEMGRILPFQSVRRGRGSGSGSGSAGSGGGSGGGARVSNLTW